MTMIKKLRIKRHLEQKGLITMMGLLTLVCLQTGCSSDDIEEEVTGTGKPIELRMSVTGFQENTRAAETRAWIPPTGFDRYDGTDKVIGISFTQDNETPLQGYFFYGGGQWRTSVEIANAGTYYLYGYTPHSGNSFACELSPLATADNSAYSAGATMTFKRLPNVNANDLCIVVGASNGKSSYRADADYSVEELSYGNFTYAAEPVGNVNSRNYVYLLFDHLYAALRVNMRVHGDYDELRTIKLKELRLQTYADDTPTANVKKNDVTITLRNNNEGNNPIEQIAYTPVDDEDEEGTAFYQSEEGTRLQFGNYLSFQGHFLPQNVTKLALTSVYDVYDKNVTAQHPDGNLIRKDCMATNTIVLKDLISGQNQAARGRRYTIYMTIQPTYLYVLSEPDLDNPSVTLTTN